jgi:hypothetical protein
MERINLDNANHLAANMGLEGAKVVSQRQLRIIVYPATLCERGEGGAGQFLGNVEGGL